MRTAIALDSVSKHYRLYDCPRHRLLESLMPWRRPYHRTHTALYNITLSIPNGQILGILGTNGSGKSTLLKIISKVLEPSSGDLLVDGRVSPLLELGSGFNPEFTGLQNVHFYGAVLGMSQSQLSAREDDIVRFADIGDYLTQPVKTYSTGMRSRLAFAVAAHTDPQILILDEVLAVGDIRFQRKCFDFISDLKASGRTIILVSHSLAAITNICDRAIILHQGALVGDGKPKDVVDEYTSLLFRSQRPSGRGQKTDRFVGSGSSAESSTESKNALSGSRNRAEIDRIDVADEAGRPTVTLWANRRYTITMRVRFRLPSAGPIFGILIRTVQGVTVFGINTHHANVRTGALRAGDTMNVRFLLSPTLAPGQYFVSLTVGDFTEMYDAKHDAIVVEVLNTNPMFPNSIADLRGEIQLEHGEDENAD